MLRDAVTKTICEARGELPHAPTREAVHAASRALRALFPGVLELTAFPLHGR